MHPSTIDAMVGHGSGQDRDHIDHVGPPDPHPVPSCRARGAGSLRVCLCVEGGATAVRCEAPLVVCVV